MSRHLFRQGCEEHNNANVLTMGQRVIGPGLAGDIVAAWLQAEFQGRHDCRVAKICAIEKYNCSPVSVRTGCGEDFL